MTEDEAKEWLARELNVSRETTVQLEQFERLLIEENCRQNLISDRSVSDFWGRHIVDSAQLVPLTNTSLPRSWLDLGTGAGFPGIVVAMLTSVPITLVDSRKRRAEFLLSLVEYFGLRHVLVMHIRLETLAPAKFDVISARAFAPLSKLFALALPFATPKTTWLLPKGRSAQSELDHAQQSWQGMFHVKQSVTDPEASIIVASRVARLGTV